MRIILSRTDSIGDVVLTLPVAAALKQEIPGCKVIFLGREYTRPVVELCKSVDEFVVWYDYKKATEGAGKRQRDTEISGKKLLESLHADAIIHVFPVKEICTAARQAKIPLRIATARRLYTWLTCNKLLHIPRKNSSLHESQLNLKLLQGLNLRFEFPLSEISGMYNLSPPALSAEPLPFALSGTKRHIILHPKSKGSAREWGLDNFSALIGLLPPEKYQIFISGTKDEGELMGEFLHQHRNRVTDLTGKLSLPGFIQLIANSDALVAASTGPLHIAAALGIRAVGLYAPMRPIFPQRWAPVGKNASFLVLDKPCNDCRKTMDCHCIRSISAEKVAEEIFRA